MRVLVVGAGIIGSIYGWALADGGHDVVHLLRPGRASAYANGIQIDMIDRRGNHRPGHRREIYAIRTIESLAGADGFDLIVVPVKHYELEPVLREIVPNAGTADFLLLTQNWSGVAAIDALLPRGRYAYGDAKAGGSFEQGTLVAAIQSVDIGAPEGEPTPMVVRCAEAFNAGGLPTTTHADMLHYLWVQYAITGGLWAALVEAGSLPTILSDREAGARSLSAVRECLDVVARRGVDLAPYHNDTSLFESHSRFRQSLSFFTLQIMFRFDEFIRRTSSHAFGDPREVRTFYDDLMRMGSRLGVNMPVMESYRPAMDKLSPPVLAPA